MFQSKMSKVLRSLSMAFAVVGVFAAIAAAQYTQPNSQPKIKPSPTPTPAPQAKGPVKITTADQVAETAIVFYGFPVGRERLNQIRKTTLEKGQSTFTNADGKIEKASY